MLELKLGMLRSIGRRSVSADHHILWLDRYSYIWPISCTDHNLMTSTRDDVYDAWGPVFELYRGLWGSPLFFFFITGGFVRLRVPQKRTYNDLQRYITATSVCTTCFMQALYRINHYTVFTLLLYRHELIGETTNSHPQIVYLASGCQSRVTQTYNNPATTHICE